MVGVHKQAVSIVKQDFLHEVRGARHVVEHRYREINISESQRACQLVGHAADNSEMYCITAVAQLGACGGHDAPDKTGPACHSDRDVPHQAVEKRHALVLEMPPLGQYFLCTNVDCFAKGGGRHALGPTVQQPRPKLRLELMDALAEAGLRDVQHLGGLSEAASFESRHKPFELTQVHGG